MCVSIGASESDVSSEEKKSMWLDETKVFFSRSSLRFSEGVGHMTCCLIAVRSDEDLHVFRLWEEVGEPKENFGTRWNKLR